MTAEWEATHSTQKILGTMSKPAESRVQFLDDILLVSPPVSGCRSLMLDQASVYECWYRICQTIKHTKNPLILSKIESAPYC